MNKSLFLLHSESRLSGLFRLSHSVTEIVIEAISACAVSLTVLLFVWFAVQVYL